MSLEIITKNHSNHCKLTLVGKCTVYNSNKIKDALLKIINENENTLIDLSRVSDFDTAGMQLFISAKNTAQKKKKKLKFIDHPICVIAILDLYGLTSFFGDKIVLSAEDRKQFPFRYGIRKGKNSL